jgi:large subunit ribosomal protein L15
MKIKKRKKSSRYHGRNMGTCGTGARKKQKGSGHRGGKGMAGTGKRADQKKTLITRLYGNDYFGKRGITSKKTEKDKRQRINLRQISLNLEKYGKKSGDKWEIDLKDYKILGDGEIKNKLIIRALEASASAIEKTEKAGGRIILPEKKKEQIKDNKKTTEKQNSENELIISQTSRENETKSKKVKKVK